MKIEKQVMLICGRSNLKFAKEVSKIINVPLADTICKKFSDGEIYFRSKESVRGRDIYIIQPASDNVNEDLMELLIMVDAVKRSSPDSITVVMPYYYYCRQDKQMDSREPITAKLVANLLQVAGVNRVFTIDFHAGQLQGFFDIPTDNLSCIPYIAEHIKKKKIKDLVVVSPDAGGAKRARVLAKIVDAPLALIDKRREQHNKVAQMRVIGDVEGKNCVLVDDIIDTAGTILSAVDVLKKNGAKDVYITAVHPVLSGPAIERLKKTSVKEIIVTDSIPIKQKIDKIKVYSIAPLVAKVIIRIHEEKPLSTMFK